MIKAVYCQSCMMPLLKDTGVRESEEYCSLCFKNGALVYQGNDLKEFQRISYESMRSHDMGKLKAKFFTFMIRFAKRWQRK